MSRTIQRIPLTTTQQNQLLGHVNIEMLLDLFTEAVFIFNKSNNIITHANEKFFQLTSTSQCDIKQININQLFGDDFIKQVSSQNVINTSIIHPERESMRVRTNVTPLDEDGKLFIIKIKQSEKINNGFFNEGESKIRQLLEISRILDISDLNSALEKAVNIAIQFLGTDFITIYKADNEFPGLRKLITSKTSVMLPDTLPSTDFIKLANSSLWLPGKRIVTELHRYAKSVNMSFMASTPLGQEKACFGLLVIGGFTCQPKNSTMMLLEVIAAQISNIISHNILKNNLNKRLQEGQFLLSVRNILTENIREGVIILNPNLIVREINPAAEMMLGYTYNEVIGQPIDNILIGADILPQVFDTAKNGVITHDIGSVYLHQRNGQSFPAHIQVIPIVIEDEVRVILTIVSDMSEKEQIQLRTRQLEHRALLGEFASVFAHEVRNPINNISTGLQLLASRFNPDDPNQEVIERTQNDCVRLNHLMESFLSFSRPIDHSKFDQVDINQLIQRVIDRWHPRFTRVNVKPLFQPADESPKVYGDSKSLERVFINLISNAVDVMSKDGGTLAVRVKLDKSIINSPQVEITITDSGPGIPDEIKNKIFEPFVTTKVQGTGLGLAITKHILTEHRGSIQLNTFTGGTVFRICLPSIIGAV